jgi:hypothetical protein
VTDASAASAPPPEPERHGQEEPTTTSRRWPRGTKRRFAGRWTRRLLMGIVAVVAAVIYGFFSIDLGRIDLGNGRSLRELAERRATAYLERPMHIGRIRADITPGSYTLYDVVIEGRQPTDRPFLTAKRINVQIQYLPLLQKKVILAVRMSDWQMVMEMFKDGHNLPRFTPKNPSTGKRSFTTTVRVDANNGAYTFDDHVTPWSVVCQNLSFSLVRQENLQAYVGIAGFDEGTVQIQKFQPMWAKMRTRFSIDGPRVVLPHIDLTTDGAESHVSGWVDFSKQEHVYNVSSTVNFPRMKELFFTNEKWRLAGDGEFRGTFHLYKGGRELLGQFTSEEAHVNDLRFQDLHGALVWDTKRFAVTHADSRFYGGEMNFAYSLEPLGSPRGATASFSGDFSDVDAHGFTRLFNWGYVEPDARMTGIFALAWPNGHFGTSVQGEGEVTLMPAATRAVASVTLPPLLTPPPEPRGDPDAKPETQAAKPEFDKYLPLGRFPVAGRVVYSFDPDAWSFTDSWIATPGTYVSFSGTTSKTDSRLPFHVTSHDWQESSRLLAAILSQFGSSRSGAVEVTGRGLFDGTMTGRFSSPRIEGRFAGERMRAWDVTWGPATGDIVIENRYVTIAKGVIGVPGAPPTILADGKFSLGYPRDDDGDEIDAHVVVRNWPLQDIRHAFGQDGWPVDGTVGLADLQLKGQYTGPFGSGKLRIDQGIAWGERFASATGDLVFEGTGLRIRSIEMAKGTGTVTGTAILGWDSTYTFNVAGERINIESLDQFKVPTAPLTGSLRFTAKGTGTFDSPSYTFDGFIADLYARDEGIGQVRGRLVVKGDLLTIEQFTVQDPRLSLNGGGTITLDDRSQANLRFSFVNSSLDPYLKFYAPKMSPYTRIIASGSVGITGLLSDRSQLQVEATVDETTVTLLDYTLKNEGDVRLSFAGDAFKIGSLHLAGQDTKLDVSGGVDAGERQVSVVVTGSANLAILQLFSREIEARGKATVAARLEGPYDTMALTGEAQVVDGRLKLHALPHSISDINGPITMDGTSIRVDNLRARLGEGDVTFMGSISLNGYVPEQFQLRATGTSMHLRYPPGLQSTVNANLQLVGPVDAPRLIGDVEVLQASFRGRVEGEGLLALASGGTAAAAGGGLSPVQITPPSGVPITLDIRILTPAPVAFIETRDATIEGRANLQISGTIDRPELIGEVEIERGELIVGPNRVNIRRGSIEFLNRTRIDPVFDVELETRPRSGSQVFTVNLRINGTFGKFAMTADSDPYLTQTEILSLLLGAPTDVATATERQLRSPQAAQEQFVQLAAAQIIASPITSRIGSVFERFPVDTVQVTPLLFDTAEGQKLNPSARVTLGKRISSKVYLTYSRTVGGGGINQEEIVLIEYEQSDRISWVLSRNEDNTFALDFRVRYIF